MTAACPFCGDEDKPVPIPVIFKFNAVCPNCGATGPLAKNPKGALTLWNNREAPGSSEAWRKQYEKIT